MSITLFAADIQMSAMLELADNSIKHQVPLSFFNLRGAKVQGQDAFTFTSARKGFSMIVAESPKALEMRARASALYNLEEKAALPQTQWIPSESFSSHSATLTTIKCIKDMATPFHRSRGDRFPKHYGSSTGFKFWSHLRVQYSEPRRDQGYGFQ